MAVAWYFKMLPMPHIALSMVFNLGDNNLPTHAHQRKIWSAFSINLEILRTIGHKDDNVRGVDSHAVCFGEHGIAGELDGVIRLRRTAFVAEQMLWG